MKSNPGESREVSLEEELQELLAAGKSPIYKALVNVLVRHKDYCYKEAMRLLENKQDREADCVRAEGKFVDKLSGLINQRIEELKRG